MNRKTSVRMLVAAGCMAFHFPAMADALSDNKVVRSTGGDIVRSTAFGTCVRSKWESGSDACAPAPQKVATTKIVERTVLSKAEKTVYFGFDDSGLSPQAQSNLDGIALKLKQAKDVQGAEIVGYADRKGSFSYNKSLSEHRAQAVKDYLAQQGYLNTRVAEVRGLSEANPVTDCPTGLSRAEEINCLSPDRRVEVEIRYTDTQRQAMRVVE